MVWTTHGFLLSHQGFSSLKFRCLYIVLLAAFYLLLILIDFYKVEKFYFRYILLCCYCVLIPHQSGIRALGYGLIYLFE
jgi:hypothetical protein